MVQHPGRRDGAGRSLGGGPCAQSRTRQGGQAPRPPLLKERRKECAPGRMRTHTLSVEYRVLYFFSYRFLRPPPPLLRRALSALLRCFTVRAACRPVMRQLATNRGTPCQSVSKQPTFRDTHREETRLLPLSFLARSCAGSPVVDALHLLQRPWLRQRLRLRPKRGLASGHIRVALERQQTRGGSKQVECLCGPFGLHNRAD